MEQLKVISVDDDEDPRIKFQIIDGERRWQATKMAKILTIRADEVVVVAKGRAAVASREDQLFLISAIANIAKEPHQPMEFARILARTQKAIGATISELSAIYGRVEPTIVNHLSYLKLAPQVQAMMEAKIPIQQRLIPANAKLLVGWPEEFQIEVAIKAVAEGWTASQTARYIKANTRDGLVKRVGFRVRKPSDDFAILESVLAKIDERTTMLIDVPTASIEAVLRSRGAQAKAKMLLDLRRSIKMLTRMEDIIKEINLRAN